MMHSTSDSTTSSPRSPDQLLNETDERTATTPKPAFIKPMLIHLTAHLQGGQISLKWLEDMVRVQRIYGQAIDWAELWRTARRWKIGRHLEIVIATLNCYWGLGIDTPTPAVEPLSRDLLIYGRPLTLAQVIRNNAEIGGLSFGYWWNMAFPDAPQARTYYKLSENSSRISVYFTHYLSQYQRVRSAISRYGGGRRSD